MTNSTKISLDELEAHLQKDFPEKLWLHLLTPLSLTGVIDNQQLLLTSGLSRDQLHRKLVSLHQSGQQFTPLLSAYKQPIKRGGRGRPPKVYFLEALGAKLLRKHGVSQATASGLREPRAIAHALCMVDFHLKAEQHGLACRTDNVLRYGDHQVLRPDHVVTLPDQTKALFEIEQHAKTAYFRRILSSLQNKQAFFSSRQGKKFSPTIRMLFNLEGPAYQSTLKVWERALHILAEREGTLAFKLVASPLSAFLEMPVWDDPPQPPLWNALTPAALTAGGTPALSVGEEIPLFSSQEDHLILEAMLQALRVGTLLQEHPHLEASAVFFDLMLTIYMASYDPSLSLRERTIEPWSSIFLLKQYLKLHPALQKRLTRALHAGQQTMRWNPTNILHRMQVVVDTFLRYHGWGNRGGLQATPFTPGWQEDGSRTYQVRVRLQLPAELAPVSQHTPLEEEVQLLEEAVGWVLTALFKYAPELALGSPPFW